MLSHSLTYYHLNMSKHRIIPLRNTMYVPTARLLSLSACLFHPGWLACICLSCSMWDFFIYSPVLHNILVHVIHKPLWFLVVTLEPVVCLFPLPSPLRLPLIWFVCIGYVIFCIQPQHCWNSRLIVSALPEIRIIRILNVVHWLVVEFIETRYVSCFSELFVSRHAKFHIWMLATYTNIDEKDTHLLPSCICEEDISIKPSLLVSAACLAANRD